MTVLQKLRLLREEHYHEIKNENAKQFIEDVYEGVRGVPSDIIDEDLTEYLSPRQIQWINDLALCCIGEEKE